MEQSNESADPPTQQPSPSREYTPPDYWRKPKKWWPKYLAAILLVLVGFGLYWLFTNKTVSKSSQTPKQPVNSQMAVSTKDYSSVNFSLNFSYPQDWVVLDNGNNQLTVTSPATQLKSAVGAPVTGKIIMTIAQKGQNLHMFDKGSASAVMDSQKISYSKPTQSQRGDTYVSYVQYANTTTTGALDGIVITGDYGYQKNQDVLKLDIANLDPLVSVTFALCGDSKCSIANTPLSVSASNWNSSTISKTVLNMLKSLSFN